MKSIDQLSIRKQNLCRLWDVLFHQPGITRPELSKQTRLSQMTVGNLVDFLEKCHAVHIVSPSEGCTGVHGVGRRADLIYIDDRSHAFLEIDLTNICFRFCAYTLQMNRLLASEPFVYNCGASYLENLQRFLKGIRRTLDNRLEHRQIIGMVVIVPGPYNILNDTVNNKRIPGINGLRIKSLLHACVGDYPCYVDEDVKLAVRAYIKPTQHAEDTLLYLLYIRQGVGGAAIYNDTVLRGLNAVMGDAGQLSLPSGQSYESALSLHAFARCLGIDAAENLDADVLLQKIYALARANPALYAAEISKKALIVAQLFSNLVWLLDPTEIVIDCQYAALAPKLFIDTIHDQLASLVGGGLPQLPRCTLSSLEPSTVLTGAMQALVDLWFDSLLR